MEKELKVLLQDTGDSIADVFDQMLKGNWRDDHGHSVMMNAAIADLKDCLRDIMEFRAKHLDYTAPAPRDLTKKL